MNRRTRLIVGSIALAGLALAGPGCEKPLFPEAAPRSPYERYMLLRGQDRPTKTENAFGFEVPDIRNRLKPLGSP